jgi:radical SAM superfamily enzyme YgiQ (UPF0313 family)
VKVLFAYTTLPDSYWGFKHSYKFTRGVASLPPLGLLTIASILPTGWEARLIDENVEPIRDSDILWADVVFISAMLIQKESVCGLVERCGEFGVLAAVGGPMVTAEPDVLATLKVPPVVIVGEGERVFGRFLRDLSRGRDCVKRSYAAGAFCEMWETPIPWWSLIRHNLKRYLTMPIQFGRGCPHLCDFCNVTTLFGGRMRLKSVSQVLEELSAIFDIGWTGPVFFVDDNFIGNIPKAKELLIGIAQWQKKRGYPFRFFTQTDIRLADDPELLMLMTEAGFRKVFIGIETVNADSLKEAHKGQNLKGSLSGRVELIQRSGIEVQAGFIVGFDHDVPQTIVDLEEFIQKSGIVTAMVGFLLPLPGTRLMERLKKDGRLLDVEGTRGDNVGKTLGYVPKMGAENLIAGYKWIQSQLYRDPVKYGARMSVLLRRYRPFLLPRGPSVDSMRAFLLSILYIGIFSRARRQYWKSLLLTLRENPGAFPLAVILWIFWVHFDAVAEGIICEK